MVNVGVKYGMKESLLEGVSLTPLYIGRPFVKGFFFVCTTPHLLQGDTLSYVGIWVRG